MAHLVRRFLFAVLAPAVLALPACAGNGVSPTSAGLAPVFGPGTQRVAARVRFSARGLTPDATCPKAYSGCLPFRISTGLVLYWCSEQTTTCDITNQYVWSGGVCKRKATPCTEPTGPFVKSIRAKWSGPFPCQPSIPICGSGSTGTYVVDALTAGNKPPKVTNGRYAYKQDVHRVDGSAITDFYIGLSVAE